MIISEEIGILAKITGAISGAGGNIIALGTFLGEDPTNGLVTIKVDGLGKERLMDILRPFALRLEDVREV
jgi:acetoin utilization protein AcuB